MIDNDKIFSDDIEFEGIALKLFSYQATHCKPYHDYIAALGVAVDDVTSVKEIPFLPIEIFKSHRVYCETDDIDPDHDVRIDAEKVFHIDAAKVFHSSGTSGMTPSSHYVADLKLYEESFVRGFEQFYGDPHDVAIFALLPGYSERDDSSLVYMVDRLINISGRGGFYLNNYQALISALEQSLASGVKTILIGVSFALLDMVEKYTINMPELIVMETGGMKNHRQELSRDELHESLCRGFGVAKIHSEYGMTELLSQGYSSGDGLFAAPPWLDIVIRDLSDPFSTVVNGVQGGVNIIDLANVYSCSFIETGDMGIKYDDGTFRILGRIKGQALRGCNMLLP